MEPEGRWFEAGILGLINGFLPEDSSHLICSKWDDPDPETKVRRFLGFGLIAREAVFGKSPDQRYKEAVEAKAQEIYFSWKDVEGWVGWVPNGNSDKQNEARELARQVVEQPEREKYPVVMTIERYEDLQAGDHFIVGTDRWEVVDDNEEDEDDPHLGVWTNACRCVSPSLCEQLIAAKVPIIRMV